MQWFFVRHAPGDGSSSGASAPAGSSSGGSGDSSSGGTLVTADGGGASDDAGNGTTPDATATPDAGGGSPDDAGSGTTSDATTATPDSGSFGADGGDVTPMGSDSGPQPSYAGEIPIYYGTPVAPIVKMQCPGDPTQGWTEYVDTFHVEYPYKVPLNTRFSIIGGIYNFWVFPNDSAHSPTANGTNPRTEACLRSASRYGERIVEHRQQRRDRLLDYRHEDV